MKKITFGRLPDNDIVLDDQSVSRHHGYLMIDAGRVYIADESSMNGIYVNGARIREKERLENGDQVMISNRIRLNWERYAPAENNRTVRVDNEPTYKPREKAERFERQEKEQKKTSFWDGQAGKIVKYILTMVVSVTVMTLVTTLIRKLLS